MSLNVIKLISWTIVLLWTVPAFAEEVKIGGATVTLTHPTDFCPFDKSQTADSRAIALIEGALAGRNRLLGAYALCDELPKWRSGSLPLLTEFVQHQTPVALMQRELPKPHTAFRKQFCDQFRGQGQAIMDKVSPEVDKRIASMSDKIKVNEQRMFGVIDGANESCFVLLLQKISTENDTTFVQLAVLAPVIVKSRLIFTYIFIPFNESIGGQPTVDRLRSLVAAMEAANQD